VQDLKTTLQDTIANRQLDKTNNPIANSTIDNRQLVDMMLDNYSSLINTDYKKWFAKRFYGMDDETVAKLASQARCDGKDPRKLFAYLVKAKAGNGQQ